jgi:hypothetical protein
MLGMAYLGLEWEGRDESEMCYESLIYWLISHGCGCYVMLCPHGLCPCGNSNAFGNGFLTAHKPTAGLSLDGSLTQLYCSIELNRIVACVT